MNSTEKNAVKCMELDERAAVYKLLSDCYQSPDEEIFDRFNIFRELIGNLYPDISLPNIFLEEDLEELKVDHARLFIGPFSLLAPPYGSIYLEHADHLMTDSTMNAQRWYQSEGMDIAIHEIPDHIRIELEFVCYLIFREQQINENQFQRNRNSKMLLEYRTKQKAFLEQHPGKWIAGFDENVRKHAQTLFYRELSDITVQFILSDLNYLRGKNAAVSHSRFERSIDIKG